MLIHFLGTHVGFEVKQHCSVKNVKERNMLENHILEDQVGPLKSWLGHQIAPS